MPKSIELSNHAKNKITVLDDLGFKVEENEVINAIKNAESVVEGKKGRKIAQRSISERHVLRVIFEEDYISIMVITLYPARRERYEDQL